MGKKDKGANEAAKARADEEARQKRIRDGTNRVNSIFDGQTTGTGAVTGSYDPTKTYYNADGSVWKPRASNPVEAISGALSGLLTGGRSSDSGSHFGAPQGRGKNPFATVGKTAAQQFAEAQSKLFSGTKKEGGFGDSFYEGRRKAYSDYATPQLETQYGDAQKQLTFSLDRGGLLDSSVRGEKLGELQKMFDLNKQQIADKALSYETDARNSIEDARANLISTLNATGDAEGAASSAIARSKALSQPAAYSPLGQLFTDFTAGLGIQAAQERSYAAGGARPAYNTGLFSNTGRTTVNR